jgi:ribonuclease HI
MPDSHDESAEHSAIPHVTIYTDGACSGNPGPGGYGAVLMSGKHRLELSAGFRDTTNNRMELLGVISALEALKRPSKVELYSDSQYVIHAIEKGWLKSWQAKGWRKADKKPVLNIDLWKRLLPQLVRHQVKFKWTRGHAGDVENERCDELAVAASQMKGLPKDIRTV